MLSQFFSRLHKTLRGIPFHHLRTFCTTIICFLTVYGRVQDALAVEDRAVAGALLVELSRVRKRNMMILCVLLQYYAQIAYMTAAAWVVFLILLSTTIIAFCDSIYPDNVQTLQPLTFALLHSIQALSTYAVLFAEMIRVSKNRIATVVCQTVLAVGLGLLLWTLKRIIRAGGDQDRIEEGRGEEGGQSSAQSLRTRSVPANS